MKRSLIIFALASVLANAAFAQSTPTGDGTYDQVQRKNAREASSYSRSESLAREQSAEAQTPPYGQPGIYNFNP